MTPTRPAMRYPGGKWRLAPWIISHLPPHEVYVEPFGGACSVLLRKEPSRIEVYNDIDSEVVALFRVLRDPVQAEALRVAVGLTPFSRQEFDLSFDRSSDPIESCRRLIVRMFQGIGNKGARRANGWRTRTAKAIWSPCLAWNGWAEHLPEIIERLRYTIIECLPYSRILDIYDDEEALFYLDPPYPLSTRSHGKIYSHEMDGKHHDALLEAVIGLRGMVVLSSYPSAIYRQRLQGWTELRRRSRAQTNAQRTEVLWLNPAAASRARQTHIEAFQ